MGTHKEKPIFRGLTIAAAGDLGGGQWTDASVARWVELRAGKFVRETDDWDAVTHLVCSADEFKRMGATVKAALKRQKTCQIVTRDWLEDSMLKRRRLPEEPFSHLTELRKERQRERKRMLLVKGLEQGEKAVNPTLYHLYRDHTFFTYEVVLTRDDEENGMQGERYILAMHESNAKPHLYWFVAKYYKKKGDTQAKIHRPSDAPGLFCREFALFQFLFQIKTGIPWAQRLVRAGTTDKRLFRYLPPTGGKPVGWVPAEYVPVETPAAAAVDGAAQADATALATPDASVCGEDEITPTSCGVSDTPALQSEGSP